MIKTNPFLTNPYNDAFGNGDALTPQRPLEPVKNLPVLDRSRFKNLSPTSVGNGILDLQDSGAFVFNEAVEGAKLRASGKGYSLFEKNVNTVEMYGLSPDAFNQSLVKGNVQMVRQSGENSGTNSLYVLGDLENSLQSGTNAQNELIASRVGQAIMNGEGGTTNRLTATDVDRLALAGSDTTEGKGTRNDAFVTSTVKELLTALHQGKSSGVFNVVGRWEDSAVGATTELLAEEMAQAYLEGQGNKNHLRVNKGVKEFAIGQGAEGNDNRITADEGIERFGILGKNNTNQVFSFSGLKASEAVLQGAGNETKYFGNGQQTVRIGGNKNKSIIETSDLISQTFTSAQERQRFVEQQKDTLQLGGTGNEVRANLGVGNDAIYVHANAHSQNSQYKVTGGEGQDTLTLQGQKQDWFSQKNKDGSTTFTHKRLKQVVTVESIENICFSPKMKNSEIGFRPTA
jgi:hypothetical protein